MNNQNYLIIMAGGAGTRLWPLSRKNHPKQFCDLLNTGETLIQSTAKRFEGICPVENIFVVTNREYEDIVKEQLPALPKENILLEPAMKNTAPCVAYAVYKIAQRSPDANIVVAPSDQNISDVATFQTIVNRALELVSQNDILLTLGMEADHPNTGYGYIQVDEQIELGVSKKVKAFTEKPDLETAIWFLETGEFLWNSGMFFWNALSVIRSYQELLPDMAEIFSDLSQYYYTDQEQAKVNEAYYQCNSISIDYGIMEKANNVYVVKCDIGWSDLGTWKSLHTALPKDEHGNALLGDIISKASKNNIVRLPSGQVAVINGLENMIVVEHEGVLVICDKDKEQELKQIVGEVKATRDPKYI